MSDDTPSTEICRVSEELSFFFFWALKIFIFAVLIADN